MRKIFLTFLISLIGLLFYSSCSSKSEHNGEITLIQKQYQDTIITLKKELAEAKKQIEILSYPADQRYSHIIELFKAEEYGKARKEIEELKKVFPNAPENEECKQIEGKIVVLEKAKEAEEERIKALGFKAITEQTTSKIDYNSVSFSGFSIGKNFIHDSYDDRYFYNDVDRGCKFISLTMTVKSESHDPNLPQLAMYVINGDKMQLEGCFRTEFARWEDYATYLGNYHDSHNDFSKVNTVKFKLGLQVTDEKLSKPYAIVLLKKNVLTRKYERFENPPISYVGDANYPSTLTLDDFKSKYVIIKRYNLK